MAKKQTDGAQNIDGVLEQLKQSYSADAKSVDDIIDNESASEDVSHDELQARLRSQFLSDEVKKLILNPDFEDVYTKENENVSVYYTITVSDAFYQALEAAGIAVEKKTVTLGADEFTVANLFNSLGAGVLIPTAYTQTIDFGKLNTFTDVVSSFGENQAMTLTAHVTTDYDSGTYDYSIGFTPNTEKAPTGIQLIPGNIIL